MILAGDIGGTKTHLALYEWTESRVEPVRQQTFYSRDYGQLEEVLEEFLKPPAPSPIHSEDPDEGETQSDDKPIPDKHSVRDSKSVSHMAEGVAMGFRPKKNVVNSNGRRETVSPASWYSSLAIVVDGKAGRRVVTLSADESAVRGMHDEIVEKGYRTSLYGRRRRDVASPELVWADSGR